MQTVVNVYEHRHSHSAVSTFILPRAGVETLSVWEHGLSQLLTRREALECVRLPEASLSVRLRVPQRLQGSVNTPSDVISARNDSTTRATITKHVRSGLLENAHY